MRPGVFRLVGSSMGLSETLKQVVRESAAYGHYERELLLRVCLMVCPLEFEHVSEV